MGCVKGRGRLTSHDESIKGKKKPCYFRQSWHFECLGSAPYWAPCSTSSHSLHVLGWPIIVARMGALHGRAHIYLNKKNHLVVFFSPHPYWKHMRKSNWIIFSNCSGEHVQTKMFDKSPHRWTHHPWCSFLPSENSGHSHRYQKLLSTGSVDCKLFYIYLGKLKTDDPCGKKNC